MDSDQAQALRRLLLDGRIAALGTLHNGEPAVSMVPYALLGDGRLVIHVSRLATHTQDMQRHPGVSLMVVAERVAGVPVQATARASLVGTASPCAAQAEAYAPARAAYLERFPGSEPMFDFADFSLVLVSVRAVRFVGGFAQAASASAARYEAIMGAAP